MAQQSSAMSITQLCNIEESEENKIKLESSQEEQQQQQQQQQHFIRRLPIVNSAIKAYENSSSVAEMIESYTGPIYDKLGYDRKLKEVDDETTAATTALARASLYDQSEINHRHGKSRPSSRSTSPHRPYTIQRPIPKSRWQQIVLNAGSAAGTTAAVISDESMKCLKYCLSWLQYAIQHIEQQMNLLRNFLVSLAAGSSNKSVAKKSDNNGNVLASIKKEIVDTLRKVVEVVSKYAGSGLPEQAKASVRSFILQLPSRWAILNHSNTTTRHTSPTQSPLLTPTTEPLSETSIKLLDFSSESIEMLNSVSTVFSDTIDRAELWLKRLKVVGVNASAAPTTTAMDTN